MIRTEWIGGPLFASLAAGPVFSLALAIKLVLRMPGAYDEALVGFGVIFILCVPVGFVFSLIPNIAGAALLAWTGRAWYLARHPLVWAASGGLLGWLIGAAAMGSFVVVPVVMTGVACALICRMLVSWPD